MGAADFPNKFLMQRVFLARNLIKTDGFRIYLNFNRKSNRWFSLVNFFTVISNQKSQVQQDCKSKDLIF